MGDETMDQIIEENDTDATTDQVENDSDIEQVAEQAENPDAVRRALTAERESAKKERKRADDLAAKVKEYEDRDKSEAERQSERIAELEGAASKTQVENLRLRVAIEKGLPGELIDRLKGDDREALEADADELLKLVTKTKSGSRGDADQGARTSGGIKQITESELKTMKPLEIDKARREGRLDAILGKS